MRRDLQHPRAEMTPNWIVDDPEPQMILSKTRNGMKFATRVEISISLSQADLEQPGPVYNKLS